MSYPPRVKDRARELYLELGGQVAVVHAKMLEEFGDKSPASGTLTKWFNEGDLSEVQKNLRTDALVEVRVRQIDKIIQRQEEHKQHYRQLIDKAGNILFKEENPLEFATAMEATRALDIGIQGERNIAAEQINLQFVEDLFNAVMNAVRDESILKEIGVEFRKILTKYGGESGTVQR